MTSITEDPRIGVIGLGNAGQALVQALSVSHSVFIFDRDPARSTQAAGRCVGAPVITANAAELAAQVHVIFLSLPSPDASMAVARQIAPALRSDTVVVETSTVRPRDVDNLQEVLATAVFDAAVVGGVAKLAVGRGVFLVGPSEKETGIAGAVLRSIAEEIFFLDGRGNGMRAKLVVNAVSHTAYLLLLEAASLAAAQHIPLEVFYRLMERESGLMRPLTHRFRERLCTGNFAGGMSTVNARKDSALILETARELGVPLFAIAASHGVYEMAVAEGLGSLDYASIGKLWEKWLGIAFSAKPSP